MEGFPKPNAAFHEHPLLLRWQIHQVGQRHFGPKTTNASGDSEGVVVKLGVRGQGRDVAAFVCRTESFQIQTLPADDEVEALEHSLLIVLVVLAQSFNDQGDVPEKLRFMFIGLNGCQRLEIRKFGGPALNDIVLISEVAQECLGFADL